MLYHQTLTSLLKQRFTLFRIIIAIFLGLSLSANLGCSEGWITFNAEDKDNNFPVTLSYKSLTGTQTNVLRPQFKLLNTESALNSFLDTIPSRTTNDNSLPAYDSSSEQRVGIISIMKPCEYNPVLTAVRETEDVVQVRITNQNISSTNCNIPANETYRYFVVVFENTNKPITVLTETASNS